MKEDALQSRSSLRKSSGTGRESKNRKKTGKLSHQKKKSRRGQGPPGGGTNQKSLRGVSRKPEKPRKQ